MDMLLWVWENVIVFAFSWLMNDLPGIIVEYHTPVAICLFGVLLVVLTREAARAVTSFINSVSRRFAIPLGLLVVAVVLAFILHGIG